MSGHGLLPEAIADLDQLQLLLRLYEERGASVALDGTDASLEALRALHSAGLVEPVAESTWRYAATGEAAAAVDRLVAAYRANPAEIIRELSARAIERVRTAALRTFADAFVIGRKKDG